MVTKLQRWGNSQGLRLARRILEEAHLAVGDQVEVAVRNRKIIIRPVRRFTGRPTLKELVAKIPKDYKTHEVNWGRPAGKEVW